MQHRLMTEYEWRKQARASRSRKTSWGAQCLYPHARRNRLFRDRSFQRFLLILAVLMALLLPFFVSAPIQDEFVEETGKKKEQAISARQVQAVSYLMPTALNYQMQTFTREQLLRGKMMLVDENHPMPLDTPTPNTASIAKQANGMVPVRSLSVKTGRETIDALSKLFVQLRQKAVDGLYVWQGATSDVQQRQALVQQIRRLMAAHPPEEAVKEACQQLDWPGTGALLQEYAVELRMMDHASQQPDERALEETAQGQTLMQLAWRYGFVRAENDQPYRFRYVGQAHATAMTYLALDFESYLNWLHQKGSIVISAGGQPQYLILCQPMNGSYIAFDLPAGCIYEASLDNTGYALVACTL